MYKVHVYINIYEFEKTVFSMGEKLPSLPFSLWAKILIFYKKK